MKLNRPAQESWNHLKKIDSNDWIAQPKFDGIRTNLSYIDNKVSLVSQHDGIIQRASKSHQYPEVIMGAYSSNLPEGTVLDGELCIIKDNYNADLYSLLSRQVGSLSKATKLAEKNPATFMAFDVLRYKGESVTDLSWQARNDILQSLGIESPYIKTISSYNPMDLVAKIQPLNMEGMVIKRKDGSYHSKWLKMKYYQEYDFKITGTVSKNSPISSIELETDNGDYAGKVNSNNLVTQSKEFAREILGKTATVRCRLTPKGRVRESVLIRIQ